MTGTRAQSVEIGFKELGRGYALAATGPVELMATAAKAAERLDKQRPPTSLKHFIEVKIGDDGREVWLVKDKALGRLTPASRSLAAHKRLVSYIGSVVGPANERGS